MDLALMSGLFELLVLLGAGMILVFVFAVVVDRRMRAQNQSRRDES